MIFLGGPVSSASEGSFLFFLFFGGASGKGFLPSGNRLRSFPLLSGACSLPLPLILGTGVCVCSFLLPLGNGVSALPLLSGNVVFAFGAPFGNGFRGLPLLSGKGAFIVTVGTGAEVEWIPGVGVLLPGASKAPSTGFFQFFIVSLRVRTGVGTGATNAGDAMSADALMTLLLEIFEKGNFRRLSLLRYSFTIFVRFLVFDIGAVVGAVVGAAVDGAVA